MSRTFEQAKSQEYKFWNNKPVMKLNDTVYKTEQINSDIKKTSKSEPVVLPKGYTWNKVSLSDEKDMTLVADFITKFNDRGNDTTYIEQYTVDKLVWQMNNTGYFLTVNDSNNEIVGLIGYTYRTIQINDDKNTVTIPMFMCCDRKYRTTGIAKVLIDETIRQSLSLGIDKGAFITNRIVPKPVATIRQYSRPIDYHKLRSNDFVNIGNVKDDVIHDKLKISLKPNKKYVIAKKDKETIELVHTMYSTYMQSFNIHIVLNKDEIENLFFNDKYVRTLIIHDNDNKPIDFVSYNYVDIINTNKKDDNTIKACNILMYTANKTTPELVFINVLKQISADKIQIVYINDMMHSNESILSPVKSVDEDTDDEEENAVYDMNLIKTGRKLFLNLFNIKAPTMKQNMISWLLFN